MKKILINNDLFSIAKRLKKIDKSYFVVFNKTLNQYEVHSKKQKGSTLCFVVGDRLNASALTKAYKTSVRFAKNILKNVLEQNQKLEQTELNNKTEKFKQQLTDYLQYAFNKSTSVNFDNANKTIWY
ncbi:MAG: hypothetical protein IJW32_01165 [Clostridia bacterium]|nr:hypothetical protein [Clostridia bacterium]